MKLNQRTPISGQRCCAAVVVSVLGPIVLVAFPIYRGCSAATSFSVHCYNSYNMSFCRLSLFCLHKISSVPCLLCIWHTPFSQLADCLPECVRFFRNAACRTLCGRFCTYCATPLDWRNSDGTLRSPLSPHTVDTVWCQVEISLPVLSYFVHTTAVSAASGTIDSGSIIDLSIPDEW